MFNSICTSAGLCSTISGLVFRRIWSNVQQYCQMTGLVLACVQQYCRMAGLVLACVQQLLDGWSSAGLCSEVYLPYVY